MEGSVRESNCRLPNFSIGTLISRVQKMSKNVTIDKSLNQILDEFLEKLKECDKYIAHGIFNTNFAEAALFLENTSTVYGKKVDMFWDILIDYQKRLVLCDEKNSNHREELEKIEERRRKYKRRRKTKADESQSTKLVSDFSFGNAEHFDYLNKNFEPNNLIKEWGQFDRNEQTDERLIPNKPSSFTPDTLIHSDDNEFIGRYDQFHSTSLVDDFFHLEKHSLIKDDHNCVTKMRIDCYAINDFLLERSIPSGTPVKSYINALDGYISNFLDTKKSPLKENRWHTPLESLSTLCSRESHVVIERLPLAIIRDKLRRFSEADSMLGSSFDDDQLSSISDHCPENEEIATINGSIADSASNDHLEQLPCDANAKGLDTRNKSCSQDSAFFDCDDMDHEPVDSDLKSPITNTALCFKSSVQIPTLIKSRVSSEKRKISSDDSKLRKSESQKKRRISKRMLKLSTGITVDYRDFEKFCRHEYKPAENEGQIPEDFTEFEASEPESDEDNDAQNYFHTETPREETIGYSDEREEPSTFTCQPSTSTFQQFESQDHPSEIQDSPSELPNSSSLEEEEASRRRVREWRSYILPKVKQMENKSDFDIHEYGSQIMEPVNIGEKRYFKDIVKGQSAAEVARHFTAVLQLANTNNVEICGVVSGEVANETFQVKVVDKTRHHELLEEYQAPSEKTFIERLSRVQALNPNIPFHSTPSTPSKAKKIRLSNF